MSNMIGGYLLPYLRALATPLPEMRKAFEDEHVLLRDKCFDRIVLDIGAGVGRPAYLLHTSCKDMYLVDNDPEMVKIMKERFFGISNVHISEEEATALSFGDNLFDISLATYNFIGCLKEPAKLVPQMKRVTKEGGLVYLCAWNTSEEATHILKRYYPSIGITINHISPNVTDTDHGVVRRHSIGYLVDELEKNGLEVLDTGFLGGGNIWTYAIGRNKK